MDCDNPCGYGGWLCCPSDSECFIDSNSQAGCATVARVSLTNFPTPPLPAFLLSKTSRSSPLMSPRPSKRIERSTSSLETPTQVVVATTLPTASLPVSKLQPSTSLPSVPPPHNGMSSGTITGIALGTAFGVGLIALAVFLLYKRRVGDMVEHGADSGHPVAMGFVVDEKQGIRDDWIVPETRGAVKYVYGVSEAVAMK
ncbi:hypothetical protein IG631_22175 [Alternaria alternata]|nr:hypothetical protein IG631_22175 [Alternaria alternata]